MNNQIVNDCIEKLENENRPNDFYHIFYCNGDLFAFHQNDDELSKALLDVNYEFLTAVTSAQNKRFRGIEHFNKMKTRWEHLVSYRF